MSGMPKTSDGSVIYRDAAEWFKHRSYDYRQFSDLQALSSRKRDLGLTVSAVLPCLRRAARVEYWPQRMSTRLRGSQD
jgi:hypothetical protein